MITPRRKLPKDADAQVGIGTMIVFIATILVAAIAAGVLIETAHKLQDKSTRTGTEATRNVGSSVIVQSAIGLRNAVGSGDLEQLDVYIQLAAGADAVNVQDLIFQYNDGAALTVYGYGGAITATAFTATWIRDDDTSGASQVMTAGDLVRLTIGEADAAPLHDIGLGENVQVDINLVPSTGTSASLGFQTPASYGQDTRLELF